MPLPTDYFRVFHTRDSGKPVLLNILTTGPVKPAQAECGGGTAVWVLGRQEPFYICETIEQFCQAWSIGLSDQDITTPLSIERPPTANIGE